MRSAAALSAQCPPETRLRHVLSGYVERGDIPGMVALLSRHHDRRVGTLGALSLRMPAPVPRNAVFRTASLATPLTAAAAMILIEACGLCLD
ncbi:MAG: serine hydrolase [Betaproteobacteria bacterium]|nr:serine hydrolase [Betaproteobacteria bacterium]